MQVEEQLPQQKEKKPATQAQLDALAKGRATAATNRQAKKDLIAKDAPYGLITRGPNKGKPRAKPLEKKPARPQANNETPTLSV